MIAIGCDHGGFLLKEIIKSHLEGLGYTYTDCGCFSETPANYPDAAGAVAKKVQSGECEKGILICSTGIGICIAANRYRGIRAALCHDPYSARMCRLHNDANVLCMGGLIIGSSLGVEITEVFLKTEFSGEERHLKRIEMIENCQ